MKMSYYSRQSRYSSRSRSPYYSRARSRSRSYDSSSDAENPGNNLYVNCLSSRVTRRDLEKHFSSEGEVVDIHLVTDPWTRESRGFGFVTMARVKDADRCIKYLDRSVLEGRVITVEKARRRRGRTPTPGRYLGGRTTYEYRRSPTYSPYHHSCYDDSPRYSLGRDRSYSPYYRWDRPYSPCRRRQDRSYSVYHRGCDRSYSPHYRRCYSRARSPDYRYRRSGRYDWSYSPDARSYSRDGSASPYYQRSYRSVSRSVSPPRHGRRYRSPGISDSSYRGRWRSYTRSASPGAKRSRQDYSRSCLASPRKSTKRNPSRSVSPEARRDYARENYAHSRSRSRSVSRSSSRSL